MYRKDGTYLLNRTVYLLERSGRVYVLKEPNAFTYHKAPDKAPNAFIFRKNRRRLFLEIAGRVYLRIYL